MANTPLHGHGAEDIIDGCAESFAAVQDDQDTLLARALYRRQGAADRVVRGDVGDAAGGELEVVQVCGSPLPPWIVASVS